MPLNGAPRRYFYNGERVLEELSDSGTMQARYTTENDSYYGQWLHLYRPTGSLSRFPMYDNIGSTRGLLDASGTATDWYELDTFGRQVSSSGTTPNPYRFGAAWGYITDPSGMLQLGQRFYWPEVGRFIQQDPIGDGTNWYAYAENNPLVWVDPEGWAYAEATIGPNGQGELRLYHDNGKLSGRWCAQSGLPGQYDPVVPGNYRLDPRSITDARRPGIRFWRRWRDREGWGPARIPLEPTAETEARIRRTQRRYQGGFHTGGFFLHGGTTPGSAGCVQLSNRDLDQFLKILREDIKSPIGVRVR